MITITKSERKDNNKGVWLAFTYLNDKGEEKTTNIFDKEIVEQQFKGEGKYEATWIQKGKYFNICKLELIAASANGNGVHSVVKTPSGAELNVKIVTAALSAVAHITSALVGQGLKQSEAVEFSENLLKTLYVSAIANVKEESK